MPDELHHKVTQFVQELPSVVWADVAQVKRRARRRSMKTVAIVPVLVFLIAVTGWFTFRPSPGHAPLGPPSPGRPAASVSAGPRLTSALLRPEDVGAGWFSENSYAQSASQMGGAWALGWDSCPGYRTLRIAAPLQGILHVGHTLTGPGKTVFANITEYAESVAPQVMDDARRVVQACSQFDTATEASTESRPSHAVATFTVLENGFTGDESLLIRQRFEVHVDATGEHLPEYDLAVTIALVRRGNVIAVVTIEADEPQLVQQLAVKAAARLCLASKSC